MCSRRKVRHDRNMMTSGDDDDRIHWTVRIVKAKIVKTVRLKMTSMMVTSKRREEIARNAESEERKRENKGKEEITKEKRENK